MHVQNLMNDLWDIRIFLGLVLKESSCIFKSVVSVIHSSFLRILSPSTALIRVAIADFHSLQKNLMSAHCSNQDIVIHTHDTDTPWPTRLTLFLIASQTVYSLPPVTSTPDLMIKCGYLDMTKFWKLPNPPIHCDGNHKHHSFITM